MKRLGHHCLLTAIAVGQMGCSLPATRWASPSPRSNASAPLAPARTSPSTTPATPNPSLALADGIRLASSDAPPSTSLSPVVPAAVVNTSDSQSNSPQSNSPQSTPPNTPTLRLSELEIRALANHPSLQLLQANLEKALGYRLQVGLRPNPTIGYQGMQLADQGTDQHTLFIEREYVRGDKLRLNRAVLSETIAAQEWEFEVQRQRVLTDVRLKYWDAYAAQERLRLVQSFQSIADKGVQTAELRKKGLEGSQLEVLQAEIQREEWTVAVQQSQVDLNASLQSLAALIGEPCSLLAGPLEEPALSNLQPNVEEWRCRLLQDSPELQVAYRRLAEAQANLCRQQAQPISNLIVQMGAGVDNGTNSGMMNLQVGGPLPVANQNQGNIRAAQAEIAHVAADIQRIEQSILHRLADATRELESAQATSQAFQHQILPKAQHAIELAEKAYQAGEYSFLEVLTVRKTFCDANLKALGAQIMHAQALARLEGYLLSGGLDTTTDHTSDDNLRGQAFTQQ